MRVEKGGLVKLRCRVYLLGEEWGGSVNGGADVALDGSCSCFVNRFY
jgi:hypothetical protein